MLMQWQLNVLGIQLRNLLIQLLITVHDFHELRPAHGHGLGRLDGPVKELRALPGQAGVIVDDAELLLVEYAVALGNDNVLSVEDLVEEAVADGDRAFHDEDHLEDLVVLLLDDVAVRSVLPWLQVTHEVHQERLLVLLMLTVVHLLINQILRNVMMKATFSGRNEILLIFCQEVIEKIINYDLTLHRYGQFFHKSQVPISFHRIEPVAIPRILEKVLYLRNDLLVEWIAIVEAGEQCNPFGQITRLTNDEPGFVLH